MDRDVKAQLEQVGSGRNFAYATFFHVTSHVTSRRSTATAITSLRLCPI